MPIDAQPLPIQRQPIRNLVFEQLLSWIESGALAPREIIRDTEIAQKLGVSRTPVREALQMLEHHGAVQTFPGKSMRVAEATPKDAQLVYPPLAALEALAVEMGGPHLTDEDLTSLDHINEEFHHAIDHHEPVRARELDNRFHDLPLHRAENRYLSMAIESLRIHTIRLEAVFFEQLGPGQESYVAHQKILAALRRADIAAAREYTRENFLLSLAVLKAKYNG
jgi:DNA-binding GntR family transcriptional regulator